MLRLGRMQIVAKPSTNAWVLHRLQDLAEGAMPKAVCTSRFLLVIDGLSAPHVDIIVDIAPIGTYTNQKSVVKV